ncbi:MAG: hypothetical protein ACREJ2_01450 [Planctomycetota bacterium]
MKMAVCIVVSLLLWCTGLQAAQVQIATCDDSTAFSNSGGVAAAAAATHHEGTGAVQITSTAVGTSLYQLPVANQGSFWNSYDGVTFWVKGESGASWGVIELVYDSSNYFRYFATFPIVSGSWTQVTIPWNEFLQRNFCGKIENNLSTVFMVGFTNLLAHDDTTPGGVVPAQVYDVDDIELVSGLSVTTPPNATGDLRKTVAKMIAKQPVTIVAMGASVVWGLKLQPNQDTEHWPTLVQNLLRTHYGYSNINVIDIGIGGGNTFTGELQIGNELLNIANIDMVMMDDWYYNDEGNAVGSSSPDGPTEVADNYGRLMDILLNHGFYSYSAYTTPFEILYCDGAVNADPANLHLMDPYLNAVVPEATARNIPVADWYHPMQNLGATYIDANYYTNGDYVHFNAAGHAFVANIVYNKIITLGEPLPGITTQPANATVTAGATATFSVVATNADSYQWEKNGGPITGATAASYTTPATVIGDNGATFTVVVTNVTGNTTSNNATLTVNSPANPVTSSASHVDFTAPTGSVTVVTQTITLHNTSGSPITVTPTTAGASWLNIGSAVTIPAGNTVTVTFTADPSGLNGTYTATITLTNSTGEVQSLPVSFTVGASSTTTPVKVGGCDLVTSAGGPTETGALGTTLLLAAFLVTLTALRTRRPAAR